MRAVEGLIRLVRSWRDEDGRRSVVEDIARADPSYSILFMPTLLDLLQSDSVADFRADIAYVLRWIPPTQAVLEGLRKAANMDPASNVRQTASEPVKELLAGH